MSSVEKTIVFKIDNELKQEFLDKQKKGTKETYSYVLKKVDEFEQELGKPIYYFNFEEIDELLLVKYKNKSKWVVQSTISPLKQYVYFCINKNVVRTNENRFAIILDYDKYVNVQAQKNIYVSKIEARELQKNLVNAQDKLILELLTWGIRGRTEIGNTHEELINLMVSDIDWDDKVLTVSNNDNKSRPVYVDDYTCNLIQEAIKQETYHCSNGVGTVRTLPINDSIYVFRTPGKNKYGKVDQQLFTRRIQHMRKWLKKPWLTIGNLYFSAMIDYALSLKQEKGQLSRNDYVEINKIFNYGKTKEKHEAYVSKITELVRPYL